MVGASGGWDTPPPSARVTVHEAESRCPNVTQPLTTNTPSVHYRELQFSTSPPSLLCCHSDPFGVLNTVRPLSLITRSRCPNLDCAHVHDSEQSLRDIPLDSLLSLSSPPSREPQFLSIAVVIATVTAATAASNTVSTDLYSPVSAAMNFAIVLLLLQYALPPLNLAFIVYMALMNHAFVHPTSVPLSYALRSRGLWYFSILNLVLCSCAAVLSVANVFTLYRTYHPTSARYRHLQEALTPRAHPRLRFFHVPLAAAALLLAGSYALLSALAFRNAFARRAYVHACDGYVLMAEVEVLRGFGYDGGNSSVLGASSRVRYYRDGLLVDSMDLVRDYRMPLGFAPYRVGAVERVQNKGVQDWGIVQMGREGFYNTTTTNTTTATNNTTTIANGAVGRNVTAGGGGNGVAGGRGRNDTVKATPSPVGGVRFDLRSSSYNAVYTNATTNSSALYPSSSTGTFNVASHNLSFPSLRLEQTSGTDEWRFTDHVCLPPRISMGKTGADAGKDDIRGEMSWGCTKYRICALKNDETDTDGWWDWVENVWPVVTGVVAWEVEKYSACCIRNE